MEIAGSIEVTKALLLFVLLTVCSFTDLSVRRIPNTVLVSALMTSLFLSAAAGGLPGITDSVAGLVIGLLMLLPMHLLGRMGAGDIKLLGVVGSVLGAWGAFVAGLATMIAGGVLGIIYIIWILAKPAVLSCIAGVVSFSSGGAGDAAPLRAARVAEIPYAVAIAVGTFLTLVYLDLLPEVSIT